MEAETDKCSLVPRESGIADEQPIRGLLGGDGQSRTQPHVSDSRGSRPSMAVLSRGEALNVCHQECFLPAPGAGMGMGMGTLEKDIACRVAQTL